MRRSPSAAAKKRGRPVWRAAASSVDLASLANSLVIEGSSSFTLGRCHPHLQLRAARGSVG